MRFSSLAQAPKKAVASTATAETIQDWEPFTAISVCLHALEGLAALYKTRVTPHAKKKLIAHGLRRRGKPDSLKLSEGKAIGSAYVRRFDVRHALDPDALNMLGEHIKKSAIERDDAGNVVGIEGITTVVASSGPQINAAYLPGGDKFDEVLLKRIDKILDAAGIDDFIVEADTKTIVAETALDAIFLEDEETVNAVYDLLGSVTLRPVMKDLQAAWKIVQPLLSEANDAPETAEKPKRRAVA